MTEENNNSFASFMQKQSSDNKNEISNNKVDKKAEKEKTALEIKEEEDKKERDEAKKESKHNASKYAAVQANLIAIESRRFLILLPFIICAILLFIVVITRGGSWVQKATQFGMSKIRGE